MLKQNITKDHETDNPDNSCDCDKGTVAKSCCVPEKNQNQTLSECCESRSEGSVSCGDRQSKDEHWIIGEINTAAGKISQISTKLNNKDIFGTIKMRLGIGRMNYKISPGLYAAGSPDKDSPVFVTANYKLTFDALRKTLDSLNVWVLVLDTKGVNVWCAAGKGTFGTEELVNQIFKTKLFLVVAHRNLILPQLGAPGVSGYLVKEKSGFVVKYGPVRAEDIKAYLAAGFNANQKMRRVRFNTYDRMVLTPIEWIATFKLTLMILGVLLLLNIFVPEPFGLADIYGLFGAFFVGCVITPLFLPIIPGRAFAWKGWVLGMFWAMGVNMINGWPGELAYSWVKAAGFCLVFPAISAYYAMNFTGSSTYTSLSGVIKEMKRAVPLIGISLGVGTLLLLASSLLTA